MLNMKFLKIGNQEKKKTCFLVEASKASIYSFSYSQWYTVIPNAFSNQIYFTISLKFHFIYEIFQLALHRF